MEDTTTPQNKAPLKKVHVETWGCQMNVADSEQMLGMLEANSYVQTNTPDEADLILLNTCHIREKAKHKVLSRLGRLRQMKELNPQLKVAVAGCVAQAEGKKLLAQSDIIDVLLGPGKINELPELLARHEHSKKPVISIGFDKSETSLLKDKTKSVKPVAALSGKNEVSRFVNIQQGCNNYCTFCVVPFTRGREISRSPSEIVSEVKGFIEGGAKEITLLGQNVNSYGLDLVERGLVDQSDDGPFVSLLAEVARVEGLERLRFTTSNPHDFSKPLADLFAITNKLGRYIHLPVQSGDDEVLQRMRRKVTVAEYHQRVK